MKFKSLVLVIIQVGTIIALFIKNPPVCDHPVLIGVQVASLLLLAWTWFNLVPGKFHIIPDAMKDARLVTTGPFRFIRHPMYLGLFLYLVPLVINYFSYLRLIILIVFLANMIIKLLYEENLLMKKFPEYATYMKRSYRLIPLIF
jgi:protein-S-isoprenylcysteine O-methyltransferase Ste14